MMTQQTVEAQVASQDFDACAALPEGSRPRADERRKGTREFDVLALETKHSEDFENSSGTYFDGEYDAKIGCEPSEENWISYQYRLGYLNGIAEKYDDKFGLI